MVRDFDRRPIDVELVDRILMSALSGPSAGFTQGFDLLVLEGNDQTERFWAATPATDSSRDHWPGVMNAPLIVVPLSDEDAYRRRFSQPDKTSVLSVPWWLVDTSFAAMILLLRVVDAELGATFFRVNDPHGLRREFGVPERHDPIGAIAIGYPRQGRRSHSAARARRPFDEMVHRGGW